ncbi:MAG: hybrid sensor histidine kinase/response regulator [Roseovarius gahaiensis]
MIRLSDALRRLNDAKDVQTLGTQMLAEELNADRASFAEVDLAAGQAWERCEYRRDTSAASHAVDHELSNCGPAIHLLRQGLPLVIDDIRDTDGAPTSPAASEVRGYAHAPFRAQLTIPILRNDELVSIISVRHDQPHRWNVDEIAMAHVGALRIWEALERARAEASTRRSEKRFRALVTASSQVVYRMSPDWEEMQQFDRLGVLRDTALSSAEWLNSYVHPDDQRAVCAQIREVIETRSLFEMEHRIWRSDGSLGWVLSRAVPVMNAKGEIQEWFGAATDITSRRKAEEKAQQAASLQLEEARSADARKSQLIATLAHDLRTPLVAILGALDLLRYEEGEAAAQKHVLDRIERDGHGMLQLIDDVLDLARLGAGELRLRPEVFDPAKLLDEVADIVRSQAAAKGTEVATQAAAIPPLFGDVSALRRILINFASNAVKATEGGQIQLQANADAPGDAGWVVTFSVADTGHGIAPEDIPRLFRDFGTLDREDVAAASTGLGLAICRRLASAMDGEVGVESTPGNGAHFWLRLTLPEAERIPVQETEPEIKPNAFDGLRVLVAEDDEMIRQITCVTLTRYGAEVAEAVDGLEAVEHATAEPFDLILMDHRMPNLSGATAAARIRRSNGPSAQAHIVCFSAHQASETSTMLGELAFDAWLPKPLDCTSLAKILHGGDAATAERPHADTLFDPAILAALGSHDDGTLLRRSLAGLAEEITEAETELPKRLAADDARGAGRFAHKLAGLCNVLGAHPLGDALLAFEILTENAAPIALQRELDAMSAVLQATRAAAKKLATADGDSLSDA